MNKTAKETTFLTIPLDGCHAFIPLDISYEDFQLILDTLALWQRRIARPIPDPMPLSPPEFETKPLDASPPL
jgi:hypothetical protein